MQAQDIFNIVAQHLFTQGKPAKVGVSCRYRANDGLKCAVGALIPDDIYTYEMEEKGVVTLNDQFSDVLPGFFGDNVFLLSALQMAHDSTGVLEASTGLYDIDALKDRLRRVADRFELSAEVLDAAR